MNAKYGHVTNDVIFHRPSGTVRERVKGANDKVYEALAKICNACMTTGYYPKLWKKTEGIMIAKPDKDGKIPGNYYYICLCVILCHVHVDFELMFFSTNIQSIDQQKNCFHLFSSSGYIKIQNGRHR